MNQTKWERRLRRAEELCERRSSVAEVLGFYRGILEVQRQVYNDLLGGSDESSLADASFRQRIDIDRAARWLPEVLTVVEKRGPGKLAEEAKRLNHDEPEARHQTLVDFLDSDQRKDQPPAWFFARFVLQPCAQALAEQIAFSEQSSPSNCPVCGDRPQFAVLRPEGDGGKRHLACSLCSTEWEFRRILCPVCGEVDYSKLPHYTPDDPLAVRVEACDTCKFYLKSFDMTADGLLVPEVDEIATVALDLWAVEKGYRKVLPNVMGF